MNLEYIEDLIEKENINLIDTYLEDTAGAYMNYDKINVIIYDTSKLETSFEEKQVLAEELGHYYMDATYKFNSTFNLISKQEYRAKKWAYFILVPYESLRKAIRNGFHTIYELADFFDVTIEYMQNAIEFYINKYGGFECLN